MKTLLAVIIGALAFQTQAAITIDASRVIYSGKDKSASLKINNRSSKTISSRPGLIRVRRPQQRLTHCGHAAPGQITPRAIGTTALYLLRNWSSCRQESLFWVNIQEVPPAPEGNNILQFAIRTRLKLFYRPQGIATSLPKAVENLQWQQSANTLSLLTTVHCILRLLMPRRSTTKAKSIL